MATTPTREHQTSNQPEEMHGTEKAGKNGGWGSDSEGKWTEGGGEEGTTNPDIVIHR